mgnify:CR=1 FL=1
METPPLTRGRRDQVIFGEKRGRNTPAYAGKTGTPLRSARPGQKHPRLRGEDNTKVIQNESLLETPPLTRGRPIVSDRRGDSLRNTPAYAGKTENQSRKAYRPEKHPRLRGEDIRPRAKRRYVLETPPLTRGRLMGRISIGWGFWKHPRLRGEDEACDLKLSPCEETPPLTRGRPP